MSIHFTIYKQHRLAISKGEGYITADAVKAHQDQLLADPDFDPTFNQLMYRMPRIYFSTSTK